MKKLIPFLLAASLLLSACGAPPAASENSDETVSTAPEENSGPEEYIDENRLAASAAGAGPCRVFYEIFTGSFSDSDGDGIGDLRGIINRLDYLNDGNPDSGKSLGIGGIWLTPVFASPSYHKYDVRDYYSVDPDFGTMADLEELIAECHARDVLLILDLPINHSSSLNEWFLKFAEARRTGDTENPYYSFYCCRSADEAAGSAGLCPLADTGFLYECNFSQDMPEFDFDNPAVREQMLDIARFWLDKGVDGFRFDAAKYIYYGRNGECVDFWSEYTAALREIKPDVYIVAEVWDGDGVTGKYTECMNCFNFTCAQAEGLISSTARHGNVNSFTRYVDKHIDFIRSINENAFPVLFVANHDTDRAAGFLTAASGYMQMAANLYLLSPGSPFIYYGEEIGLRGSRGGANTDANRRAAMLWGDSDTVSNPEGYTYDPASQLSIGAVEQLADPNSLYSYYKQLISVRNAYPAIACGDYTALELPDTKVGGFTAELDGQTVIVLHNTTNSTFTLELSELMDIPEGFAGKITAIGPEGASLDGTCICLGSMTSAVIS